MIPRPPRSTRTATRFPYTTPFRAARQPLHLHGEEAERIGCAKVRLGGEGKAGEGGERAKIVRRHAGFIEGAAVGRVARISGGKTRLHSLDLQGLQLRATQPLIGVEVEPVCEEAGHGSSYRQTVGRSSATS